MSTTSKRSYNNASTSSSFESPYVPIELLSYLQNEQKTPFQVFSKVVMPEFKHQLSKAKHVPDENLSVIAEDDSGSSNVSNLDEIKRVIKYVEKACEELQKWEAQVSEGIERVAEDDSGSSSVSNLGKIKRDIKYVEKACEELQKWEAQVNEGIERVAFHCLDDAYREKKNMSDVPTILGLKNNICSQPQVDSSSVDSYSDSSKSGSSSMKPQGMADWDVQSPQVNTDTEATERVKEFYNGLKYKTQRDCFLCFSVFPENAIIKKKVLVHWWMGEVLIDSTNTTNTTVEDFGEKFFQHLIDERFIEPVYKKRRPGSPHSCRMNPSIRYAVICLAKEEGFVNFDSDGNSDSGRAFLVRTKERSSVEEITNSLHFKQENVRTIFNVSETSLGFRQDWFSKMKYVKVLQLGRWERSVRHLIEVEDSGFLKGLKKMKQLRYLSLRGVSNITELPDSICKLRNLSILNLNGCRDLQRLPEGIGSLEKLAYLDMYECYLISHMPQRLASLSQLQVLKGFVIGKPSSGGDQDYCKLEDLTKLKKLKKLSIHVDKSSSQAEKELSYLYQFQGLRSLTLSWSRIYGLSTPQRNFQRKLAKKWKSFMIPPKLLPSSSSSSSSTSSPSLPQQLKKLDLHYFPQSTMPEWLNPERLKMLEKMYIRGGYLCDMHRKGSSLLPWSSVKILRLKFLSNLQIEWPQLQDLFPNMVYLEKSECPKLTSFPCDDSGVWKRQQINRTMQE